MNHDIRPRRSRQSRTMPPMYIGYQRWLKQQLSNMYGWHPATAIGGIILFNKVVDLLLGDRACAGDTPSPRPT